MCDLQVLDSRVSLSALCCLHGHEIQQRYLDQCSCGTRVALAGASFQSHGMHHFHHSPLHSKLWEHVLLGSPSILVTEYRWNDVTNHGKIPYSKPTRGLTLSVGLDRLYILWPFALQMQCCDTVSFPLRGCLSREMSYSTTMMFFGEMGHDVNPAQAVDVWNELH